MITDLYAELEEFGFAILPTFVDDKEITILRQSLSKLENSSAVREKNGSVYGVRNLLNLVPAVGKFAGNAKITALTAKILGNNAVPIRAILFDKSSEANWKVPWHQI